jgi:hypothetical protein
MAAPETFARIRKDIDCPADQQIDFPRARALSTREGLRIANLRICNPSKIENGFFQRSQQTNAEEGSDGIP